MILSCFEHTPEQICGDYLPEDEDGTGDESLEISGSKLHGYLTKLSHSCDEVIESQVVSVLAYD